MYDILAFGPRPVPMAMYCEAATKPRYGVAAKTTAKAPGALLPPPPPPARRGSRGSSGAAAAAAAMPPAPAAVKATKPAFKKVVPSRKRPTKPSRDLPDTTAAEVSGAPIFHLYGQGALCPSVGGFMSGKYMREFRRPQSVCVLLPPWLGPSRPPPSSHAQPQV